MEKKNATTGVALLEFHSARAGRSRVFNRLLLWRLLLWRRLIYGFGGRLHQRDDVLPGSDVGHGRDARHLSAAPIVNADAIVLEQRARGAVEFHTRLFVSRHSGHQS